MSIIEKLPFSEKDSLEIIGAVAKREKIVNIYGEAGSGKTTACKLLQEVFGEELKIIEGYEQKSESLIITSGVVGKEKKKKHEQKPEEISSKALIVTSVVPFEEKELQARSLAFEATKENH